MSAEAIHMLKLPLKHKKSHISDFAHNVLSESHPDTVADAIAPGDLLYGNSASKLARLPKAADGKYLQMISGFPAWGDPPGGGVPSDTVVSETSFDQSASAGTSTNYSRGDHTHGTPPDPHAMMWALILG